MKKFLSFVLIWALAFSAAAQTAAFRRSGTNFNFVTSIADNAAFLVERGGGAAPANVRFDVLRGLVGGGGIVSNEFISPVSGVWYTNTTPWRALLKCQVTYNVVNTSQATLDFEIDTDQDGAADYLSRYDSSVISGTLSASQQGTVLEVLQPGDAYRFTDSSTGTGNITVGGVVTTANQITYFGTGSGGSTSSVASTDALYQTNSPARGMLHHSDHLVPDLTAHWVYVRAGFIAINGNDYMTNLVKWGSNMFREFQTNGYYAAGWRNLEIDGGWMDTSAGRVAAGEITWNTNFFENGSVPMSLPAFIALGHSYGWKIYLYTAMTTNNCDSLPTPIQYAYKDVQKMMSFGADGIQFDHCNPGTAGLGLTNGATIDDGQSSEYYKQYLRTVNQAVDDYYAAVLATNGICRPFKIMVTGSSGESWLNSMNGDTLLGANQTQFQPTVIAKDYASVAPMNDPGITNQAWLARDACTLYRPFFRPGHIPWSGIGIYGNNGSTHWTNNLAFYVLSCSPVKVGLGSVLGMWNSGSPPSGDEWKSVFYPNYSQWLTNYEVIEMLSDPLVVPASITYSNTHVEVWIRPLENGDYCLGISNLGLTNRTVNLTYSDLRINPVFNYKVRDVWGHENLTWNPASFTHTQAPESVSLFRLVKQRLNNSVRQLDVTWPMKSLTFTGMLTNTVAYSGPGSFGAVEGLYQLNGSTACGFNVPMPAWARKVTVVGRYYSDLAGTHAWTNWGYLRYHTPAANSVAYDSGAYPQYVPPQAVVCPSGNWVVVTNTGTFPIVTNTPKQLFIQMNASTNAANRFVIGSLDVRFEE